MNSIYLFDIKPKNTECELRTNMVLIPEDRLDTNKYFHCEFY